MKSDGTERRSVGKGMDEDEMRREAGDGVKGRESGPNYRATGGFALAVVTAAFFAAAAMAKEALCAAFSGSYVAWEVFWRTAAFWSAAAVLAALCLWMSTLPLFFVKRGRAAWLIIACVLVAGGAAGYAFVIRDDLLKGTTAVGGMISATPVLAAWASAVGVLAARAVGRGRPGGFLAASALAPSSVIFAAGLAFFLPSKLAPFVFAAVPLAVIPGGAALLARVRAQRKQLALAASLLCCMAAVSTGAAYAFGKPAYRPIDRGLEGVKAGLAGGRPNVIILVLDTTRADHLSVCGYGRPTTPNLERFAKDCRFYPYGESVAGWTLPAHASLFTGKYPREHGARAHPASVKEGVETPGLYGRPLDASHKTLAEIMRENGYNTCAFVSNYAWLSRDFGMHAGFAYYHDLPRFLVQARGAAPLLRLGALAVDSLSNTNGKFLQSYYEAEAVTRFAGVWAAENKNAPFFLFLNYMDPHEPYSPPPPFDSVGPPEVAFNEEVARSERWGAISREYIRNNTGLDAAVLAAAVKQYDGEIAYADHWIGRLMDTLKREGIYEDSLIIVTADHGEFLGEHQLLNHGLGVYEGALRVPILIKYPGNENAGEVVTRRVSIIDVFATVLEVLRLPPENVPARPLGGPGSLVLAEDYEKGDVVDLFGARFARNLFVLYEGDWKFIKSSRDPGELYDLAADPLELENLAPARPDLAAGLEQRLSGWSDSTPSFEAAGAGGVDSQTIDRLRALGYIGGGASP